MRLIANKVVYVILFFLSFYTSSSFAQNKVVDSLLVILQRDQTPDTLRVNALVRLSKDYYWAAKYDDGIRTAREGISLARRINFERGEADSWLALGHTLLRRGDYDSAIVYFESAKTIYQRLNKPASLANSYLFIGQAHDYLSRYDDALMYYDRAQQIIARHPNESLMVKILNSTGVTNFNKGSYETALEYYLQSIKISINFDDKIYYASALNNIGVVYLSMLQYDEALNYFLLYLNTVRSMNHKQAISVAMLNVGEVYMNLHRYPLAVEYLDSALSISMEINDKRGQSLANSNLGESYVQLKDPKIAEVYYGKAIQIAKEIKSDDALVKALIGVTYLYLNIEQIAKAEKHLQQAQQIATQTGSMLWLEKAYLYQSKVDSAKGKYESAYQSFKRYALLKDSLFNQEKNKQVIQIKELYESEKKDKEIILLREAKKIEELKSTGNRKLLFLSVIFFTLTIMATLYWLFVQSRNAKVLELRNKMVSDTNRELQFLVEKIEDQNKMLALKNEALEDLHREKDGLIGVVAHDLRSPLNKIAGLTEILKYNENLPAEDKHLIGLIQKVCQDGTHLIRDLVEINEYENTEQLALKEIDLIPYLSAQLSQYSQQLNRKDIKLNFEFEANFIVKTDSSYLARVLDNIITNAIKFSPAGKTIHIKTGRKNDKFKIIIQDEGPGFHKDDLAHVFRKFKKLTARPTGGESSTGLGLSIAKSLTEKLSGTIKLESTFGKGSIFSLEFPVNVMSTSPTVERSQAAIAP